MQVNILPLQKAGFLLLAKTVYSFYSGSTSTGVARDTFVAVVVVVHFPLACSVVPLARAKGLDWCRWYQLTSSASSRPMSPYIAETGMNDAPSIINMINTGYFYLSH